MDQHVQTNPAQDLVKVIVKVFQIHLIACGITQLANVKHLQNAPILHSKPQKVRNVMN